MNDLNLYVQFSKKNDSEQIVEGYASTEDLDSQGEIVRFEAIKKALPDYMKFGNIREMHQHSAVGKAVKAIPDEQRRGLFLSAKIVDKVAWEKVQAGVYNGFSIGGRVLKQVGNEIQDLMLNEISVVDRPANPAALFSLVKFEGKGGDNMDLKNVKKDADAATESPAEDQAEGGEGNEMPDHREIYRASDLLYIAADLCMLYEIYEMNGVDASNLDQAIELIKQVVVKELDGTNAASAAEKATAQKVYDTLVSFQKKSITAKAVKALATGEYDAETIVKAINSFDEIEFESDAEKLNQAQKLMSVAKRLEVEVDPKSTVASLAKKANVEGVKYLFRSDSWQAGYYDQMRKVLG